MKSLPILKTQREIPYVVLVGMRGAGKTILARMVGGNILDRLCGELKATSLMLLKESLGKWLKS